MVSTVLSVSWKDHSVALTEVCKTLLDNHFLVDCTIAAERQTLKAHRLILSACSPYFQMLFGEECEKHPIVILQDVSFDTLRAMIDFMYHGETQVPEERLEAFLTLAETLQIKGLNDSSKNHRKRPYSSDTAKDDHQKGTKSTRPNEDQKVICKVQSTSGNHEDSPDNSSRQHHPYHSDEYTDIVQSNCTVSLEEGNSSYEQVKTPVIQSTHQLPSQPVEVSSDAEQSVKQEAVHHVYLVPKHEQIDDESDEPTQDMSENDLHQMEEEAASAYGEQNMNPFSNIVPPESTNVLPGAYAVHDGTMAGPQDVQAGAALCGGFLGPPKRPRRSAVWQYFEEMEGSGGRRVVCSLCGTSTTRPAGGTSNMRHHIRLNHPHLLAAVMSADDRDASRAYVY